MAKKKESTKVTVLITPKPVIKLESSDEKELGTLISNALNSIKGMEDNYSVIIVAADRVEEAEIKPAHLSLTVNETLISIPLSIE